MLYPQGSNKWSCMELPSNNLSMPDSSLTSSVFLTVSDFSNAMATSSGKSNIFCSLGLAEGERGYEQKIRYGMTMSSYENKTFPTHHYVQGAVGYMNHRPPHTVLICHIDQPPVATQRSRNICVATKHCLKKCAFLFKAEEGNGTYKLAIV